MVANNKKHILPWQEQKCAFGFYCCLLKITVKTIIKANANIVNAITALKSMYISVIK